MTYYCSLATNLTPVLEQISHCPGIQVLRLSLMETSSKPLVNIFKNSTALKELSMERVRFNNAVSCLRCNVCVYHVVTQPLQQLDHLCNRTTLVIGPPP